MKISGDGHSCWFLHYMRSGSQYSTIWKFQLHIRNWTSLHGVLFPAKYEANHILHHKPKKKKHEHNDSKSKYATFKGWLVALHKIPFATPEFTFNSIFSFFEIFFIAGVTYSGKQNGTVNENRPALYDNIWDQRILIEILVPPSIWEYKTKTKKNIHQKQNNRELIRYNLEASVSPAVSLK